MHLCDINAVPRSRGRSPEGPAVALAALVAMLHLSVLAGRPRGSASSYRGDVISWQAPAAGPAVEQKTEDESSSNPTHAYNAGQLSLNSGVAVVFLTAWLRVMRMNGTHGR